MEHTNTLRRKRRSEQAVHPVTAGLNRELHTLQDLAKAIIEIYVVLNEKWNLSNKIKYGTGTLRNFIYMQIDSFPYICFKLHRQPWEAELCIDNIKGSMKSMPL
jgi:hypothetical protein